MGDRWPPHSVRGTALTFKVRRIATDLPVPARASELAAGFDLMSDIDTWVRPGDRVLIPTGFAIDLPEGFEGQIRPRSGLALKYGITVLNAPGTIDADYRGEIQVLLINLGQKTHSIVRGDRIAQLVFSRVVPCGLEEVAELSETERGAGGFGSTGE